MVEGYVSLTSVCAPAVHGLYIHEIPFYWEKKLDNGLFSFFFEMEMVSSFDLQYDAKVFFFFFLQLSSSLSIELCGCL